jgi:hypothetical protein
MGTERQAKERQPNYEGQYVALSSSGNKKIIASGSKVGPVFDEARRQGETAPTIVFVPKRNTVYIY